MESILINEYFDKAISSEDVEVAFDLVKNDKKRELNISAFNEHFIQVLVKKNELKKLKYINENYNVELKCRNYHLFKTAIKNDNLELLKYIEKSTGINLNINKQIFLEVAIKNKKLNIFNYLISKKGFIPEIEKNKHIHNIYDIIVYNNNKKEDLIILNKMIITLYNYENVKNLIKKFEKKDIQEYLTILKFSINIKGF